MNNRIQQPNQWQAEHPQDHCEVPQDKPDEFEDEDEDFSVDPPSNTGGDPYPSDEYADLGGDDDTSAW